MTQHIQVPHKLGLDLKPNDYLVYGYMRKHMNSKTYSTFVSLGLISELSELSIKTVKKSINKLIETNEISILKKIPGRSTVYKFSKDGRFFEMFTFAFLDNSEITNTERGILMAMQQYLYKDSGEFGITSFNNEKLSSLLGISPSALHRTFKTLENKEVLSSIFKGSKDPITGLKKPLHLVDLNSISQAVLFVKDHVDSYEDRIKKLEEYLEVILSENSKLREIIQNKIKKEDEG